VIHIGCRAANKLAIVERYRSAHGCKKIFVISPEKFAPLFAQNRMNEPERDGDGRDGTFVPYDKVQFYRWYYKLLAEIDGSTLIVLNECLRSQKRTGDLDLNCIRNFTNQTPHVLVFQWLPFIASMDDFMILVDLVTRSQWKRETFRPELLANTRVEVHSAPPMLTRVDVPIDDKTRAAYVKEKASLVAEARTDVDKDPHIIPRNLLLISGKAKTSHIRPSLSYVGRNNRFKLPNVVTYKDVVGSEPRSVFELPHNHIDLCDMFATTEQQTASVLVADTKADEWYWQRFAQWAEGLRNGVATLQQ
jgi:hypothetical protein